MTKETDETKPDKERRLELIEEELDKVINFGVVDVE